VNPGRPVFIEAKNDGGGGDYWTTGAISRAKLHSKHHHQQTNIKFFYSTEGENITHSTDLLTPSSPGSLPTLSLTTNSSWLPWGRVAMPFISPLVAVWCTGNALVLINTVALHRVRLVLGWVGKLSHYVTSHPSQLSLAIPPWVGAMSTGDGYGHR